MLNDVVIFTDSLTTWKKPNGLLLTDFDKSRVLSRLVKYLECWGGTVDLNDSPLLKLESLKKILEAEGIPYEEKNGFVHYQTSFENHEEIREKWEVQENK
ncbi:MAG: hypothetical protein KDB79_08900 [Acidobacteria bacterium]|nr:hypothetical protein [Acidobacteriota bacterium]